MTQAQFNEVEEWYFSIKKVFDEGGIDNPQMRLWNEIYEASCNLVIEYKK